MISLLDNTVMTNFAVVQRPDLLQIAFNDKLATSQQAFSELKIGIQSGKLPNLDWQWLPVWALEAAEISRYHQFLQPVRTDDHRQISLSGGLITRYPLSIISRCKKV